MFSRLNLNSRKLSKYLLSSVLSAYMVNNFSQKKAKNCGIIGYLGKDPLAVEVCLEGIQILQFRGYDSAGIATIEDHELKVTKCASDYFLGDDCIKQIAESGPKMHKKSSIGIGHTRWATHGRKIAINAHPHVDFSNRIALVHNGIIDNYKEIKEFLQTQNISLVSETDTEVIVQLIGYYYNVKKLSFKDSVAETIKSHLVGSYALAIINKDCPDKLIVARNGSPLLVGKGSDFFIVSSDVAAFQKYTNNYFTVENKDVLELNLSMNLSHYKIEKTELEEIYLLPKKGYDYFMLQEIMEQSETINRAMNFGGRFKTTKKMTSIKLGGLEEHADILKSAKNVIIIACGTSYFASMFVANLLRKLEIFNTIQVIDGAEFLPEYIPKENPLAIFVSQSGESFDILRALDMVKSKGVICLGIVNKVESTLARSVLCGVFVNAGREISVASTKAFTGQVVALSLAGLYFTQLKYETNFYSALYEESIRFLQILPFKTQELLNDLQGICKEIASKLLDTNSIFTLGKGFGDAIAREISLKIKEVSYIHSEAYNAGTFKHGPIAMIDSIKRTPIIIIVMKDNFFEDMITSLNQIIARNAFVVLLTNCRNSLDVSKVDIVVDLPQEGLMSSYYAVFAGQLIAYYIAVLKGYNPDKPRHLSKELTTK